MPATMHGSQPFPYAYAFYPSELGSKGSEYAAPMHLNYTWNILGPESGLINHAFGKIHAFNPAILVKVRVGPNGRIRLIH